MKSGIYHKNDGVYLVIYLGISHGTYHLNILLIPWYIPWYIPKVVYTTFRVIYTMTQPSRCAGPVCSLRASGGGAGAGALAVHCRRWWRPAGALRGVDIKSESLAPLAVRGTDSESVLAQVASGSNKKNFLCKMEQAEKLKNVGERTVGEVARMNPWAMVFKLNPMATTFWQWLLNSH